MSQDSKFNQSIGQPYQSPTGGGGNTSTGTSGKAVASLILGLLSIIGMCFTGIPGLILGIMGLSDVSKGGGRVGGKGLAIGGIVLSSAGIVWTLAVLLIGMLLPAIQAARGAARQTMSANNMRQQSLAMLNYESAHQEFPLREKNGPSWRVHILQFVECGDLYERFNLDEPWDSPNNIQLLDEMPEIYDCPNVSLPPGYTVYQVPYTDISVNSAPQDLAMFDTSGQAVSLRQITGGTSNTVIVLEVDSEAAVEWTKPADWEFDPSDPKHDLGNVSLGAIVCSFADGSVHRIPNDISPEDFKALISREAGYVAPYIGY